MPEISIIIPVYNVKQYLHQCMNSILQQSFKGIEIICVDDGSTDGSSEILDTFANKDSRVHIIHQENKGAVIARKNGIQCAKGKYIGFSDSDDWIESDMYEELYKIAEQYQVDLVSSGYIKEGNYKTVHMDAVEEGLYDSNRIQDLRDHTIYQMNKKVVGLRGSLCCKLFRAELLKAVQDDTPDSLTLGDDAMLLLRYVLEARSAYIMKQAFYHYMIHPVSVFHSADTQYLLRVQKIYEYFYHLYQHPNFSAAMRLQSELYIVDVLLKGINRNMGFEHKNLLWVNPYWLDRIPPYAKVVLYGAGELGEKYRLHLRQRADIKYVACVDFHYEKLTGKNFPVESPLILNDLDYDYIVITIKNPDKADEISQKLQDAGVPREKILWFENLEIFWKFAEADGLLRDNLLE